MAGVRRAFLMATFEQYLGIVINFAMIAALARLLSPVEIGIAVIGLAITTITFSMREFATSEFLIQLDAVERDDVRTAFTVVMAFGVFLGAGLLVASSLLGSFYEVRGLPTFLTFTVAASVIDTASQPAVALLRRKMAFGTLAGIRASGASLTAVVTIGLAASGYGYMSYAIGTLAGSIVTTSLFLLSNPRSVALRPTIVAWRKVFDFGRYKGATVVVDRVYESLPQLVLGTMMPKAAVGTYNRSSAVVGIPDRILLSSVFSVAFPLLAAEVRAGREVRDSYLGALSYITVLYWPGVLLISIMATPAVAIVLGSQWDAAVPIVRIMALASIFWFPVVLTGPLLIALGANKEAFTCNILSRSVAAAILCSASIFGLTAMALSQFVSLPFQMFVSLRFVRRHVAFRWVDVLVAVRASAGVAALTVIGPLMIVARLGFHTDLTFVDLFAAGICALTGWATGLVATRHPFLKEIAALIGMFHRTFPGRRVRESAAMTSARLWAVAVRSGG